MCPPSRRYFSLRRTAFYQSRKARLVGIYGAMGAILLRLAYGLYDTAGIPPSAWITRSEQQSADRRIGWRRSPGIRWPVHPHPRFPDMRGEPAPGLRRNSAGGVGGWGGPPLLARLPIPAQTSAPLPTARSWVPNPARFGRISDGGGCLGIGAARGCAYSRCTFRLTWYLATPLV